MKNNLKALRKSLGLSLIELAKKTNVPILFLRGLEHNSLPEGVRKLQRSYCYINNIQRFFALNCLTFSEEQKEKNKSYSFNVGNVYRIWLSSKYNPKTSPSHEEDFDLTYIGKQGKHHIFKAIHGDWTRTYTDAQLIGKSIQEVTT